ncbi:MAG TPA: SMP-30/gluconolactonase/LRE family protein [Terriglobales bacterium]|nr:SMP-30/gluconolactonase/LRE family protein [Terriglobales bacterium]
MLRHRNNSIWPSTLLAALICAIVILMAGSAPLHAKEKKEKTPAAQPKQNILEMLDYSKIVWPNPPAITRIKYLSYFSGEKRELVAPKKAGWMDRLSGAAVGQASPTDKLFYQLIRPYGIAVDSQGKVYIADEKVLAVFVYNPENGKVEMIRNGQQARFKLITGLTLDDADTLFVSDSLLKHVLVFDKQHKAQASISEGMASPAGLAVDNENRFLYVADSDLDQVLVYDADPPYKLLRTIGKPGTKHEATTPGDFSRPTNVVVDKDGNLYVADTFNNRIEIFDAEGNFIRTFGKAGDGPGYFARPKGIAIDADGHVWVADAVQDRVQVYTPEGQLLIWFGGHGLLPGQFSVLAGLAIDKNNRVLTSEQYPGRVQFFRYFTDAEAQAEKDRRDATDQEKKATKPAAAQAETAHAQATTPN